MEEKGGEKEREEIQTKRTDVVLCRLGTIVGSRGGKSGTKPGKFQGKNEIEETAS